MKMNSISICVFVLVMSNAIHVNSTYRLQTIIRPFGMIENLKVFEQDNKQFLLKEQAEHNRRIIINEH